VALENEIGILENQGAVIGNRVVGMNTRLATIESIVQTRFGDIEKILGQISRSLAETKE
jgi:hypothetical protein